MISRQIADGLTTAGDSWIDTGAGSICSHSGMIVRWMPRKTLEAQRIGMLVILRLAPARRACSTAPNPFCNGIR